MLEKVLRSRFHDKENHDTKDEKINLKFLVELSLIAPLFKLSNRFHLLLRLPYLFSSNYEFSSKLSNIKYLCVKIADSVKVNFERFKNFASSTVWGGRDWDGGKARVKFSTLANLFVYFIRNSLENFESEGRERENLFSRQNAMKLSIRWSRQANGIAKKLN